MAKKAQHTIVVNGPYTVDQITPYLAFTLRAPGWALVFLSIHDRRRVKQTELTDGCSAGVLAVTHGMKYHELRLNTETETLKRKIHPTLILPWHKTSHVPLLVNPNEYPFSDMEMYANGLAEQYQTYLEDTGQEIDIDVNEIGIYFNWVVNPDYERWDLIEGGIKKPFKSRGKRETVKAKVMDEAKTVTEIAKEMKIPKKQIHRMISEQKAIDRPAPVSRPNVKDFESRTKFVQALMKYDIAHDIPISNKEIAMESGLTKKSISAIKSYMKPKGVSNVG